MKFFIPLFTLLFFTACSHQNAFSEFSMNDAQELSITSLKRIKITKQLQTVGAFNAVYLNEVYPDVYNGEEYFFIYMYLKDKQKLSTNTTPKNGSLHITLNNKPALKLKKLHSKNRFSNLSSATNSWNQYYLVSFDKQGRKLTLKLESDQFDSASLSYQKDK